MRHIIRPGVNAPIVIHPKESATFDASSDAIGTIAIPGQGIQQVIAASTSYTYGEYSSKRDIVVTLTQGTLECRVDQQGKSGGAGTPSTGVGPALRLVANRVNTPYYLLATIKQAFGRTNHTMSDTVSSLMLVYSNYYGKDETPGTGPQTYGASIEYPVGTLLAQVTFNGTNYGTAAPGSDVYSDLIPLPIPIPQGARYRVRTFVRNPAGGIPMNAGCNSWNGAGDEISNYTTVDGTTLDYTMGAPTAAFTLVDSPRPSLILAYTSKRSIAIVGDSRATGQISGTASDYVSDANGWIGVAERAVGRRGACVNLSAPSDLLANFIGSTGANRRNLLQYVTDVFCEYGINDLSQGSATILANLTTLRNSANVTGKPFGVATMSPYSATTDNLMTLANQTPNANDAQRIAVNTAYRNGASCADYVIEVADFFESSRNSGTWKLYSNARTVADGAMTAGSNILTSATAAFTPADTGHKVMVPGAGTAGATLKQVMRYISPTTVGLYNLANVSVQNAVTTVSGSAIQIGAFDYSIDGLHEAAPELPAFQIAVQVPAALQ
jgi:hypothetical protein